MFVKFIIEKNKKAKKKNVAKFFLFFKKKMGYTYAFLILGTNPNLKIEEELYHYENSGTYGATDNHWFYTHKGEYGDYDYKGSTNMEDIQVIFYLEELQIHLDEAVISRRLLDFRESLSQLSNLVSRFENRYNNECEYIEKSVLCEAMDVVMKKWDKIESDPDIPFSDDCDFAIEELERMVNEAKKWEDKGYTNLKIIFGYSP